MKSGPEQRHRDVPLFGAFAYRQDEVQLPPVP